MSSKTDIPLVVDLDGTLTPTDTLIESLIKLIKLSPLNFVWIALWLLKGKALFKEAVAGKVRIASEHLPYRQSLLNYLSEQKSGGRKIVLATAAHRSIALAVSEHLGLFDAVLATENSINLKGSAKLSAIQAHVGDRFVYAGDSAADLPIWRAAESAILVSVSPSLAKNVRKIVAIEQEFPADTGGITVWLRALRVHQWSKNLLLFVPLLTAFSFFDISKLSAVAVGFLSFSFAASATYIVNDLLDLDNDRSHPRKRLRPFASASIPISQGLCAAAVALTLSLAMALYVSAAFAQLLLLYLIITSAYSWILKEYVIIDVIVLSLLYTLRILAGSVGSGIPTSSWLLAFSVFIFLSLALVKRCAELIALEEMGKDATQGRDYRVTDLSVIWPLGVGAALCSVVIFGLFISDAATRARYATPDLLWLVAIGLIYWLTRLLIKTSRGEMYDDPIVYAVKDFGSRITVIGLITLMLTAHFMVIEST
ncbi:UbiA family prenyltransferase [Denitromonas halophila]|uniref:UbiA family prenyltransferase n=2 Tax=Denitromonas halophila TaxID=1629404 RepID=A0A557QDK8_9RHOO|nr:UbiA family prenyltransferase [Denitromonas halophila]